MSAACLDLIVREVDLQPGEHVLDVGCGAGALSLAAADLVGDAGSVTGVDMSAPLLTVARQRPGAGVVALLQADAQTHDFGDSRVDAIVSRFGVMFFDDPAAAFLNLAGALRPGGRIVFACWRDLIENEWIMVPAVAALEHVPMPELGEEGGPGTYSLADPDRVRAVLVGAGLVECTSIRSWPRSCWVTTSMTRSTS